MSGRSADVSKDIARIALREVSRFDSALLTEVLNYCWDQLGYLKTSEEMAAIKAQMDHEGE